MSDFGSKVLALADGFVLYGGQPEEERFYLFNTETGKIFNLNKTSHAILELFDGSQCVDEIADKLSKRFAVDPVRLQADLERMAQKWADQNILLEKGGDASWKPT